jgi:LysM repeat protein
VLEATEEHHPPHFHVAVYPTQYARYVARITSGKVTVASGGTGKSVHVVRRGETLWDISRNAGTTVEALRSLNDLSGDRIVAGQKLLMPQPTGGG